jgi:hypothetical protein
VETTGRGRVTVGARLPAVSLAPVAGRPVELRRTAHESSVLVFVHPDCDACRAYVERLEGWADRLAAWGGCVLVVAADHSQARSLALAVDSTVLCDADGRARGGAGLSPHGAAVVVSDKFGIVYRVELAGAHHEFLDPGELLEEIRYMGSQCPECGVPDDPLSGEEAWHRAGG